MSSLWRRGVGILLVPSLVELVVSPPPPDPILLSGLSCPLPGLSVSLRGRAWHRPRHRWAWCSHCPVRVFLARKCLSSLGHEFCPPCVGAWALAQSSPARQNPFSNAWCNPVSSGGEVDGRDSCPLLLTSACNHRRRYPLKLGQSF